MMTFIVVLVICCLIGGFWGIPAAIVITIVMTPVTKDGKEKPWQEDPLFKKD